MSSPALADQTQAVSRMLSLIQEKDAVLLTDPQGKVLASRNAEKLLVPASTLKILTALVALHYFGEDFRFVTECYSDKDQNLKIKGYGDPLFVSDVMPEFSWQIQTCIHQYRDLILDDLAFQQPLRIPGVTETTEPYDAPDGAFCANFNTVSFQKASGGKYITASPKPRWFLLQYPESVLRERTPEGSCFLILREKSFCMPGIWSPVSCPSREYPLPERYESAGLKTGIGS